MYPKEFIEWLRINCRTQTLYTKDEIFDIYWVIIKDIDPWDDMSRKPYTTDEIYEHWKTEVSQFSDMKLGGKEITYKRLKKRVDDIQKKKLLKKSK